MSDSITVRLTKASYQKENTKLKIIQEAYLSQKESFKIMFM